MDSIEKEEFWEELNKMQEEGLLIIAHGENGPEVEFTPKGNEEAARIIAEDLEDGESFEERSISLKKISIRKLKVMAELFG